MGSLNRGLVVRPDVGLDVDGVLANFGQAILRRARSLGLDMTRWPKRWYDQNSWFPASSEEFMKVWNNVKDDLWFWLNLPRFWDEDHPRYVPRAYVTSRPVYSGITERWLAMNGYPTAEVVTVPAHEEKEAPLRERGISIYIDDRPENFEYLREAGIDCYLMDRPWNKQVNTEYRIYDVNEIPKAKEADDAGTDLGDGSDRDRESQAAL